MIFPEILKKSDYLVVSDTFLSPGEPMEEVIVYSTRQSRGLKLKKGLWDLIEAGEFEDVPISSLEKLIDYEVLVFAVVSELEEVVGFMSGISEFQQNAQSDFLNWNSSVSMSTAGKQRVFLNLNHELASNSLESMSAEINDEVSLDISISGVKDFPELAVLSAIRNVYINCNKGISELVEVVKRLSAERSYKEMNLHFVLNFEKETALNELVEEIRKNKRWKIIPTFNEISSIIPFIDSVRAHSYHLIPENNAGYMWVSNTEGSGKLTKNGFVFQEETKPAYFSSEFGIRVRKGESPCSKCALLPLCGGSISKVMNDNSFCPSIKRHFKELLLLSNGVPIEQYDYVSK